MWKICLLLSSVIHPIWSSITPEFGKNVWQSRSESAALPLTQCVKDNEKVMDRCVDNAFDGWKYYHKLDYESERQLIKASCCAMWDARDCQMSAARAHCTREALDELYLAWEDGILSWTRSSDCERYSFYYNSAGCKLTDWAIALVVIGGVLTIAFSIYLIVKCVRMRRFKKKIKFNSVNYNRP